MGVFGESFTQEVVNKVRAVNRKERAVFVGQLKFTLLHNVQSFDEAILQQIPTERLLNLRIIFKTRRLKLRYLLIHFIYRLWEFDYALLSQNQDFFFFFFFCFENLQKVSVTIFLIAHMFTLASKE
eukprot:TRINITY_DN2511_c0_g1_i2.p5 TRINITY_DN2511_c0_g1~~TRINITY_DN2511_c0_g1_i2.p5  ORF type:complete len:126 (+),score=8.70 TRINITY_DN2511_c0_g1_i2:349-726(+)